MKLKKATFGRTDYRISALGLSTSNFARYASPDASLAILDTFREAGGNFIQTSGICPGVNLGDGFLGLPEEMLGRWLKLRQIDRENIVIATRIALTRPVIGGLATYTELIRDCTVDSIRRIGCGYLDFLVLEWTDAIAPVAETMAACEAVIASGRVRHVVPANFPLTRLRESFAATPNEACAIGGLQFDYSLVARLAFEAGAARLGADHGLGVIARSPLAGGHLARRPTTSADGALRQRGANHRHAAIASDGLWPVLSSIARASDRSPAQVALAWVLAHPAVSSVLVSVSSVDQLRDLLSATRVELGRNDIARLGNPSATRAPALLAS